MHRSHLVLILSAVLIGAWLPAPVALAEEENLADRQLVVWLAPEPAAPSATALIDAVRTRQPLSGALATGDPLAVAHAMSRHASPHRPRTRSQRWVIFTYPAATDLAMVERALAADPQVESVERNFHGSFAAMTPPASLPLNGPIDTDLRVDHADCSHSVLANGGIKENGELEPSSPGRRCTGCTDSVSEPGYRCKESRDSRVSATAPRRGWRGWTRTSTSRTSCRQHARSRTWPYRCTLADINSGRCRVRSSSWPPR